MSYRLIDVETNEEVTGQLVGLADDGTIVLSNTPVGREKGVAGISYEKDVFGGSEYLHKLAGRQGVEVFDKMRRSDPIVRRTLRLAKTPILQGRWFVKSADESSKRDVEIRDFVEWCLFKGMETGWTQLLKEILGMLDFGFSVFEKVFHSTTTPFGRRTILKDLAPRGQSSLQEFVYNTKGRPIGMIMDGYEGDSIPISYRKLNVFTYDKENYNLEGVSLLRSAYKPFFFKTTLEKIDAIQKERHGIGVPIIKLPVGFSEKDKTLAKQIGSNLRANAEAHVILPPRWEILWAKVEGQPVKPIESIEYHDRAIEKNILADFLIDTAGSGGGSAAEVRSTIFLKGSRDVAGLIYDEINKRLIPQLVQYNYGSSVTNFPSLFVRRISDEAAIRILSFALKNSVGSDIVRPDDVLESWVREEFNLPGKDPTTERQVINNKGGDDRSGTSSRE